MSRFLPILVASLLASCGATPEKEENAAPDRANVEVHAADLPDGAIFQTSRKSSFAAMCKELEEADVVYLGESSGSEAARKLELQILRQLRASTRLDAIGLATFPPATQPALDEYVRGRIDWEQLGERLVGRDLTAWRAIFEFAREHRLGLVALDIDPAVATAVESGGREGLDPELRARLPAETKPPEGYEEAVGRRDNPSAQRWRDAVTTDAIVRWMRASPPRAQLAVIAEAERVVQPWGLGYHVRMRGGRSHATVVMLEGMVKPSQMAGTYADYIFIAGE